MLNSTWQETISRKRDLQDELKKRSHMFDCQGRESLSKLFDLPYDQFYGLDFDYWIIQSKREKELLDAMSDNIRAVVLWCGEELETKPMISWLPIYREWLKTV